MTSTGKCIDCNKMILSLRRIAETFYFIKIINQDHKINIQTSYSLMFMQDCYEIITNICFCIMSSLFK